MNWNTYISDCANKSGTFTVAWVPPPVQGVDHYEVMLVREGKLDYQVPPPPETFGIYVTTNLFIVLSKPKSGRYEVWVRATKVDGTKGRGCSSTDRTCTPRQPNGSEGGWKILWKPSGPIGPIIIN